MHKIRAAISVNQDGQLIKMASALLTQPTAQSQTAKAAMSQELPA